MSSSFSRHGTIYCIVYSAGKPPLISLNELHELTGIGGNWDIEVYSSERGRNRGIRTLQHLNIQLIFLCELKLEQLINISKPAPTYPLDKLYKGSMRHLLT